jgi:hypothetical protein
MTSKQPKSTSPAIQSSKAKASKSRPSQSAALPPPASELAEATSGQLVRLHDLNGVVVFYLPKDMQHILGAQQFLQQCTDLRRIKITLIVRTASDVIYVDLPVVVMDLPADLDAVANAAASASASAGASAGATSGSALARPSKRGKRNA